VALVVSLASVALARAALIVSPRIFVVDASKVPTGIGYTLLLIAHIAAAVVGFAALFFTGFEASKARQGPRAKGADAVRRYFRPGVNWAARVLYLVPVLGFALLADSGGAFDLSDSFVLIGLVLWFAAIAIAEALVWPAEKRIQDVVASEWQASDAFTKDCNVVVVSTCVLAIIFVFALVIMFGKP